MALGEQEKVDCRRALRDLMEQYDEISVAAIDIFLNSPKTGDGGSMDNAMAQVSREVEEAAAQKEARADDRCIFRIREAVLSEQRRRGVAVKP